MFVGQLAKDQPAIGTKALSYAILYYLAAFFLRLESLQTFGMG